MKLLVTLGLTVAAIGCGESTGPTTDMNPVAPSSAALFGNIGNGLLRHLPINAGPLGSNLPTTRTGFWAVQGKRGQLEMKYLASGRYGGKTFLRFTIPAKAQLVRPDGRRLARGDSLFISVNVAAGQLAAEFSPHGLVFADSVPAQLAISYVLGDTREAPVGQLGMFFVPDSGSDEEQVSNVSTTDQMVVSEIRHFSNYAVAYRKK